MSLVELCMFACDYDILPSEMGAFHHCVSLVHYVGGKEIRAYSFAVKIETSPTLGEINDIHDCTVSS